MGDAVTGLERNVGPEPFGRLAERVLDLVRERGSGESKRGKDIEDWSGGRDGGVACIVRMRRLRVFTNWKLEGERWR